ncbi:MAG: molecular chaperone DnaJ [Propionibacteriaceae bacterium]|nr:molecular chaperone DnaJ [Propionibacteriaceae bacterium]
MSTKDWLEKDYYKILGVPKDASDADIKKAFRKLARKYHPDANQHNPDAEAKFKEVSEANDVLADPAKRKEYDEARTLFGGGGFRFPGGGQGGPSMQDIFAQGGSFQGASFQDILGNLGGFGNLFGGGAQTHSRGPRRGCDVEGEVSIGFADAVRGSTVTMQTVSDAACPTCHGTGAKPGTSPQVCANCHGSGVVQSTTGGVFAVSEPCRECRGRGVVITDPCPACDGTGRGASRQSMQVRLPAGVTDGQRIRLKGKGGAGENGGAAGDLYVTVHVASHPLFGRKGKNVTVTVPITFTEAVLGAEIEVPTLDGGRVRLRVPAGTQNGQTLRVRGRGSGDADLLVTVEVAVPKSLSDEAKAKLVEYAYANAGDDPRAALFAKQA